MGKIIIITTNVFGLATPVHVRNSGTASVAQVESHLTNDHTVERFTRANIRMLNPSLTAAAVFLVYTKTCVFMALATAVRESECVSEGRACKGVMLFRCGCGPLSV